MPPLTTTSSGALVSGGVSAPEESNVSANVLAQTVKGTVVRAFYFQGQVLKVGAVVELPRIFAQEVQSAKKFRIADSQEPPKAVEPVKAAASEPRKGAKDAGQ